MGRPCCHRYATLYRTVDGVIQWRRDHFSEYTASDTGSAPAMAGADQDASGRIVQAGGISVPCDTVAANPQRPMYVVRAYDDAGDIRWEWSEAPNGTVSGATRSPPLAVTSMRVSPDGITLIASTILFSSDRTARALDGDGTVLWTHTLNSHISTDFSGWVIIGAGATQSLWVGGLSIENPRLFAVIDNASGTLDYFVDFRDGYTLDFTQVNGYWTAGCFDDADHLYLVWRGPQVGYPGGGTNTRSALARVTPPVGGGVATQLDWSTELTNITQVFSVVTDGTIIAITGHEDLSAHRPWLELRAAADGALIDAVQMRGAAHPAGINPGTMVLTAVGSDRLCWATGVVTALNGASLGAWSPNLSAVTYRFPADAEIVWSGPRIESARYDD